MEWHDVGSAPSNRDLEVAVIDREGIHPLLRPCRRFAGEWIEAASKRPLDIHPTHWRHWRERSRNFPGALEHSAAEIAMQQRLPLGRRA